MTQHAPAAIFLLGAFTGGLAVWLLYGLCNAGIARDREEALRKSVVELRNALLDRIADDPGLGRKYGDAIARAGFALRYGEEAK